MKFSGPNRTKTTYWFFLEKGIEFAKPNGEIICKTYDKDWHTLNNDFYLYKYVKAAFENNG